MDLIVSFWSKSLNQVCTRYLNSVFLGHARASDLIEKFREGVSDLDLNKLLQISMDGPSVNLKFLRVIREDLLAENGCDLLDLGSCGLHVVHGAFRRGHDATDWNLNDTFKAFYQLFKGSPARRSDYIAITGCEIFPRKFCQIRWVENVAVAERAIQIFPNIKKYAEEANTLPKTSTCARVAVACKDHLILPKFAFFSSVANILEPF